MHLKKKQDVQCNVIDWIERVCVCIVWYIVIWERQAYGGRISRDILFLIETHEWVDAYYYVCSCVYVCVCVCVCVHVCMNIHINIYIHSKGACLWEGIKKSLYFCNIFLSQVNCRGTTFTRNCSWEMRGRPCCAPCWACKLRRRCMKNRCVTSCSCLLRQGFRIGV